jgi:hypothetical protein
MSKPASEPLSLGMANKLKPVGFPERPAGNCIGTYPNSLGIADKFPEITAKLEQGMEQGQTSP